MGKTSGDACGKQGYIVSYSSVEHEEHTWYMLLEHSHYNINKYSVLWPTSFTIYCRS